MRRDASAYIRNNFEPDDRLAVVLIQQVGQERGKVVHKFCSAEEAAMARKRQRAAARRGAGPRPRAPDLFDEAEPE